MTVSDSQLDICNRALQKIGDKSITSTELSAESNKRARLVSACYDDLVVEVLKDHDWDFARDYYPLNMIYDPDEQEAVDITNITQADPAVVTAASHGLPSGVSDVYIDDVVGMTEVNDHFFKATYVDANSFQLTGVDSQTYTAYTSGGQVIRQCPLINHQQGYTYSLADISDYLVARKLDNGRGPLIPFTIYKNTILYTTAKNPTLIYTKKETTVTSWSTDYIEALIARIAAEICMPLTGSKTKTEALYSIYTSTLRKGISVNVVSGRDELDHNETTDDWLNVR